LVLRIKFQMKFNLYKYLKNKSENNLSDYNSKYKKFNAKLTFSKILIFPYLFLKTFEKIRWK